MNHQQNEDIPPFFEPILQFFNSLPPITRTWFTLSLLTTALHTLEIFDTNQLILLWDRIPPPQLELWRIITSFTWAGPGTMVDFQVLMLLYSMVVVVPGYEREPHDASWIERPQQEEEIPSNSEDVRDRIVNRWIRRRPVHRQSDCIFAFFSCSMLILLTYLLITETSMLIYLLPYIPVPRPFLLPVFTRTLLYSIITLHSLKNPDQQQNINFFPVPGRYVPLFHVVFGLLMGYRINETIHGILVGFMYACLVKEEGWLASILRRKRVLSTPQWLIQLVGEDGIEVVITEGLVNGGENANIPYRGITLESGANFLHHAATIGDVTFIQSQIDQVESVTSAADIVAATAPIRQQDRNGWQPLHEAARSGQFNVLKLLLEVDNVEDQPQPPDESRRTWRRRAGILKINVNARTNNDVGFTALRLVEENDGADSECAALLREVGGVSLGFGDGTEDEE
mmetsp:Transcript_32378/g.58526  ORF Transcript_32378/g.58526 Transcript_32378/m.58526 type:complete len:455 (+) Transcript_32378:66-1430(+)|eukprot:CAMPEP_0201931606 /NCGR_PEP_ID=MMETSP0903-20130614/27724_1 /ASSEMBLY_ACC=CAM_ASM_000552 /TAXON_ID=420261 /ORGANISM="Thalassiosira antarctica, Strain CCMP982" /LENGTH=454 /DNA_ID=CAMNT_0048470991 /DNA_START=48 /DNA_END=1412 /DNA_ORIENTATION=+